MTAREKIIDTATIAAFSVLFFIAGAGNPPGGGRPGGPPGGGPGGPGMPPRAVNPPGPPQPPDRSGPMFHQVKMALSADGLNWQWDDRVIFDHASVPGAVLKDDGTLLVYFVDGAANAISVGESSDYGQTWFITPIVIRGLTAKGAVDPDPVLLDNGSIRLYYFGSDAPMGKSGGSTPGPPPSSDPAGRPVTMGQTDPPEPAPHKIYSAFSRDGVNFTQEAGVRFAALGITDPDVIRTGKWWRMYLSVGQDILSAYSQDGLKWIADKGERGYFGAVTGTIELPDGRLRMYVSSQGIESMISGDGLKWEYEDGIRIPVPPGRIVADPSVVRAPDGTYIMFYKTADRPRPPEPPGQPGQPGGPPAGGGPGGPPSGSPPPPH